MIYDRAGALQRMANSPTILAKVVARFKTAMPPLLQTLSESLERGDTESFKRAAHSLKGAALNLGADRLSDSADHLEGQAGLPGAAEALAAAQAELDQLLAVLDAA